MSLTLPAPKTTPDKFPLDRLMVSLGNAWLAFADMSLNSSAGGVVLLPGNNNVIVTAITVSCTVVCVFSFGPATGAGSSPATGTLSNMDLNNNGAPSATCLYSTNGGTIGALNARVAIGADTSTVFPVSMPILLIPGGPGLGVDVSAITGEAFVTIEFQEYPY